MAVAEAKSLGLDTPRSIYIVARLRFAPFRPASVATYLPHARSMNAKCPGNYNLFMFANARKN